MAEYHLKTPLQEDDVRKLRIGDTVYLTGEAFTCRSRLQRYVFDENHPAPRAASQRDVLIHVGPIVLKKPEGYRLVSFMPTSSIRFEKWGARSVREWGLRMIVGKTTMGAQTMQAMMEQGCVHCSPQSVSPNLWVDGIKVTDNELFDELGSIESTWHLQVEELGPFVVDMDCTGQNLYENHAPQVDENRKAALQKLGVPEDFSYTKLY